MVAVLVYLLARRGLGRWLALAPAVIVTFLGTGSDAFLSGLNYNVLAATAACLGALLALDHRTTKADLTACALLALGLASFTTAIAYSIGVGAEILCRRDRWRRLWIPIVPGLLYSAWRLHWGSSGGAGCARGIVTVLRHSFQAATGAFAGLAGLQLENFTLKHHLPWFSPLAQVAMVIVAVLLIVLAVRRRPISPRLVNLAVAGTALWLLLGVGRGGTQVDLYSSRYVYQGAIIALLILVELAFAYRLQEWAPARVVVPVVAVVVLLNIVWMGV